MKNKRTEPNYKRLFDDKDGRCYEEVIPEFYVSSTRNNENFKTTTEFSGSSVTFSFICRLKQEAQEQKKAEEKAKREAIYQDYLKRKGMLVKDLSTLNTNHLPTLSHEKHPELSLIKLVKRFFKFYIFLFSVAEREEEEEMSKAGMSVNRRPKPKKAPRPKSQPPGVAAPGVQSSPSHSSQEDLVKQRKYLKFPIV